MLMVRVSRRESGIEVECVRADEVLSTATYAVAAEALEGALLCIGKHQHGEMVQVDVLGRGVIGASREPSVVTVLLRSHLCFGQPC